MVDYLAPNLSCLLLLQQLVVVELAQDSLEASLPHQQVITSYIFTKNNYVYLGTNSIFQPPPVGSTPAPSFNFSGSLAPSGPAPFMFGQQQTPTNNPPPATTASSTLFSSTPKINFAAQSGVSGAGGGGIFSQIAQNQSGSSSMFQFSGSSSLQQQPLGIGGGLPNTGNLFNNAGAVMQFGAPDGTMAASGGGSVFSAGLGGGTKRVIKKAARRKK